MSRRSINLLPHGVVAVQRSAVLAQRCASLRHRSTSPGQHSTWVSRRSTPSHQRSTSARRCSTPSGRRSTSARRCGTASGQRSTSARRCSIPSGQQSTWVGCRSTASGLPSTSLRRRAPSTKSAGACLCGHGSQSAEGGARGRLCGVSVPGRATGLSGFPRFASQLLPKTVEKETPVFVYRCRGGAATGAYGAYGGGGDGVGAHDTTPPSRQLRFICRPPRS